MKKILWSAVVCFLAVGVCAGGARAIDMSGAKALDEYPIKGLGWEVTSDVKADRPYTIAIVLKNNTNPWMNGNGAGFIAAGRSMGFEPLVLAPAKNDSVEEQSRIVDDLVQRGVDAIIVHPVDSNGIVPCVERAFEAGIPVYIEGTSANTEKTFGWFGTQYYDSGKYLALYIAEKLGGKGNIINLSGPPEAQNAIERNNAIHDALKDFPDIRIIAEQPANFRRVDAMQVMENLIQQYPESEIDAVIGANDEQAMGALMALEGAGYKTGRAVNGGILVAGFDCNEDASHAIKEGRMDVSINSDPPSLGWLGAAYLVQYLNDGSTPPSRLIPYPDFGGMEGVIVDSDNIDYYIDKIAWWKIPADFQ
ncbi:MAG: sugar ABC transporter substrate-binding protein [Planctomycetes bacterium]|nr:sugar ABC transporter substrate-binding protein [Planctomycetota bacterium]